MGKGQKTSNTRKYLRTSHRKKIKYSNSISLYNLSFNLNKKEAEDMSNS